MVGSQISDKEQIFRRIPPSSKDGKLKIKPNITQRHFKVRPEEIGVSVNLASKINPSELLKSGLHGSAIAIATVGQVRELGLDVVEVPEADNPGHSEIRSAHKDVRDQEVWDKLAKLFAYVPD